jgi:hypothetical protein
VRFHKLNGAGSTVAEFDRSINAAVRRLHDALALPSEESCRSISAPDREVPSQPFGTIRFRRSEAPAWFRVAGLLGIVLVFLIGAWCYLRIHIPARWAREVKNEWEKAIEESLRGDISRRHTR